MDIMAIVEMAVLTTRGLRALAEDIESLDGFGELQARIGGYYPLGGSGGEHHGMRVCLSHMLEEGSIVIDDLPNTRRWLKELFLSIMDEQPSVPMVQG